MLAIVRQLQVITNAVKATKTGETKRRIQQRFLWKSDYKLKREVVMQDSGSF